MTTLESYIVGERFSVPGWFHEVDGWMFEATNRVQLAAGTAGDLVEVGAYQGHSTIILGYLARPDETVVAIDLFDEPAPTAEQRAEQARWYGGLTRGKFEENYRRFHPAAPPTILQGRSDDRLPELGDGSARFIHVDGSHAYDAVVGDIDHAARIATRDAVIVLDDIITPHTPGVTAAAWRAVHAGLLVPLVQTNKLYTTVPGSTLSAAAVGDALSATPVEVVEEHDVAGWPVLEARMPIPTPGLAQRVAKDALPPVAIRAGRHLQQLVRARRAQR